MLKKLLCGVALLSMAGFSSAASITVTAAVPLQTTNFDEVVSVAKFDDMGGDRVLNSVTFVLEGLLNGDASLESLDAEPTIIDVSLSAEITLSELVTNTTLVITVPSDTAQFAATEYDGTTDFGGSSGTQIFGLNNMQTEMETFTDTTTLAQFTGTGETIDLNLGAVATSFATGAGNLLTQFRTDAGGNISIIYDYMERPVNAPAHIALLGFGLLAFARLRKIIK